MPSNNSNKPIALVTGGNRGIGLTLCRTLAQDHGFHVLLGSRNPEAASSAATALQSDGLSVEPLTIDLASDPSIYAAASAVASTHGHIDVLINNAGIILDAGSRAPLQDMRKMYQETFDTNVFGNAVVTEAFLPLLEKARFTPPRIVFVSSALGSVEERLVPENRHAIFQCDAYRASKSALSMVCATYAMRFREQGWKVNAACPGSVKTRMTRFAGMKTVEEAMGNLVRLCKLGLDGETGTFSDDDGPVAW